MADVDRSPRERMLRPAESQNAGAFAAFDWVLFSSVSLIWGASFLLIDIALDSLEPGLITLLRVGLGAFTLNLLPKSSMKVDRGDRWSMLLLSVLWVGIPFTLFPLAEQHINSAVTGMLNGGTPIFTAIVATVMVGTRLGVAQKSGLAVGLIGVIVISVSQAGEGDTAWIGIVLVVAATVCYGFATNIAAPMQAKYGSRPVMARMLALATVWTTPFGLVSIPESSVEAAPLAAVVVLGAIGTGIAFALMGQLVARVGPTRAVFITYLVPVTSLALGVSVRGDSVRPTSLLGIGMVIAGAVLASRSEIQVVASQPPTRSTSSSP